MLYITMKPEINYEKSEKYTVVLCDSVVGGSGNTNELKIFVYGRDFSTLPHIENVYKNAGVLRIARQQKLYPQCEVAKETFELFLL